MLKFLLCLVLLVNVLVVPSAALACNADEVESDLGCVAKDDPVKFAGNLYSYGLALIGGAALISILYGAYLVLSSQGDPSKLQNGKSYIVYAIIGLVLAVGGYAFYRIIAKDVINLPGFQ